MLGSRVAGGAAPGQAGGAARPAAARSSAVVLRWLPRDRFGALVAREIRYWWRDTRRRASLITLRRGRHLPAVSVNVGCQGLLAGPTGGHSAGLGAVHAVRRARSSAVGLANQFGYDGSAYAANIVAGVPGRLELRARVVAFSLYIVPLLVVIAIVLGVVGGRTGARSPSRSASLFAAFGIGLAVILTVSVLGAVRPAGHQPTRSP